MKIRDLTRIAFFTAVIIICSYIMIPFAVPFTLQTLGIFVSVLVLGKNKGSLAVLIYLLIGIVGVPVFSGFRGGIYVLTGMTGGFLWGFLAMGLTYWVLSRFGKVPALIAGLAVCYGCGCFWFYLYSGGGLGLILLRCVVPYLIPDAAKLWLAVSLSKRLSKVINIPSRT